MSTYWCVDCVAYHHCKLHEHLAEAQQNAADNWEATEKALKQLEAAKLREAERYEEIQRVYNLVTHWADEARRFEQELDAALSALEIARKRIVEIWQRVDLGQREGALGIIGISLTEIDAIPSAALAERDRKIREECARIAESHRLGENLIREMMDAKNREVQLWSVVSKRIAQAIRDLTAKVRP